MRASYDRETDILMIELSKGSIDHAKDVDNVIIHFTPDDEPVLLEILDASDFLSETSRIVMKADQEGFQDIRTSA